MISKSMKHRLLAILVVTALTGWLVACSDEAESNQDAGSDASSDTVFGFDIRVDSASPDAEADGQLPDATPDSPSDVPTDQGSDATELPNEEVGRDARETGVEVPPECVDNDGDEHGENCEAGPDCSDDNEYAWDTCETCNDDDEDGRWFDCNQYLPFDAPDCDPGSRFRYQIAHLDRDGDGMGRDDSAELCIGELTPGFTQMLGDCDDEDAAANPMMIEIPLDGQDNDCMDGDRAELNNDDYVFLDPYSTAGDPDGSMGAPFSVFHNARDAAAACEPDCAIIATGATIEFDGTYNPVSVSVLGGYNHAAGGTWTYGAIDTRSSFNIANGHQMVVDAPDHVVLYRLAFDMNYQTVIEPPPSLISVSADPLVVFYRNTFTIVNTNSALEATIIDAPTEAGELFVVHNTFDINQTAATTNGDIYVVTANVDRAVMSSNVFNVPSHELGQLNVFGLTCSDCSITSNNMETFHSSGPMHFAEVEANHGWVLIRDNRLVGSSNHEAFFFGVHAPDGWVTAASNWIDVNNATLPGAFDLSASHSILHNNAIHLHRASGQEPDPFAIQIGNRFDDHHAEALLTNNMITAEAPDGLNLTPIRFDGSNLFAFHNTFVSQLGTTGTIETAGVISIDPNYESVALVNNVFEMGPTIGGSAIRILDGIEPAGGLAVFNNAFFSDHLGAVDMVSGLSGTAIATVADLNSDEFEWADGNIDGPRYSWEIPASLPELPIHDIFPGIDAGINPRDIGLFAIPLDYYGTIRPVDGDDTDGPQYDIGAMEYVPE